MRAIYIILTLLFYNSSFTQSQVSGEYQRQDSKITLNSDSTFKFFYSVDTYRGWVKGFWSINKRKIYLTPIPVYDTITLVDQKGKTRDSLTLSKDQVPSRLNITENRTANIFQVEQSFNLCPTTLLLTNGKLFILKNGKRQKKKINNSYYIKAFDPWYTRRKFYE